MSAPVVVVTRERADDPLAVALREGGARVVTLPTIRIEKPFDLGPLDAALQGLAGFDWLVFTSVHAVDAVRARPSWPAEPQAPGRPRVAAVGRVTAEHAAQAGLALEVVADAAGGRALAEALRAAVGSALRGTRVLWPRAEIARRELAEALHAWGAFLVDPVAYRTVPLRPARSVQAMRLLLRGGVDAVAFLSPSSARSLDAALGGAGLRALRGRSALASIGPTTSAALRALGAPPDLEAEEPSGAGLAAALLARLASRQGAAR